MPLMSVVHLEADFDTAEKAQAWESAIKTKIEQIRDGELLTPFTGCKVAIQELLPDVLPEATEESI